MIALDIILIVLTSMCIIYCMVLNRRIVQIQKYRTQMLKLFKEFDNSVLKAEGILDNTRNMVPETGKIFESMKKNAEKQIDDIELLLTKGDKIAEELETIIIAGNKLVGKFNEIGIALKDESEEEIVDPRQAELELNDFGKVQKRHLSQHDYYEIIQNRSK
jgi:hypothetical protein